MSMPARLGASCLLAMAFSMSPAGLVLAQQQAKKPAPASSATPAKATATTLSTDRQRTSYMIGMDVGRSIAPAGPDIDLAAFERGVRNAFDGGKPLLDASETQALGRALVQNIGARGGKPGAPAKPAAIDRGKVGLLVGSDVGRSLAPIKGEIELPVFLSAVRARLGGGALAMTDTQADALRNTFTQRLQARQDAELANAGQKNKAEGDAFLARNKQVKGVFTTPSGLQYMVLRQGAGVRPMPASHVRVSYEGKLLDGKVFDSSYERGQPASFGLDQVIRGWTEGLQLMPVGAKYRFWIPGELGYGPKGAGPDIPPNSTLVFDVELLGIE